MQALAARGMGPKFLMYIDKAGRPLWCIVIQLLFGCIAYIGEAGSSDTIFTWLLSLSGLSFFFLWWSINLAHIRFRAGWAYHGFTVDQLPYKAAFGVWGSWCGLILNSIAMIATFYTSLFPLGGSPDAEVFFENYLAAVVVIALYLFWKVYSRDWKLFVKAKDMDGKSHLRTSFSSGRNIDCDHSDSRCETRKSRVRPGDPTACLEEGAESFHLSLQRCWWGQCCERSRALQDCVDTCYSA